MFGSRSYNCIQWIEIKTFGKKPDICQAEILWLFHQRCHSREPQQLVDLWNRPRKVWNFGVHFLQLESDIPKEGEQMSWGVFSKPVMFDHLPIDWINTKSVKSIEDLLMFERDPDDPQKKLNLSV